MFKVALVAFVSGALAGAGAATYAASKKAPDTPSGMTARDIALSEEAVASQTPTPI